MNSKGNSLLAKPVLCLITGFIILITLRIFLTYSFYAYIHVSSLTPNGYVNFLFACV